MENGRKSVGKDTNLFYIMQHVTGTTWPLYHRVRRDSSVDLDILRSIISLPRAVRDYKRTIDCSIWTNTVWHISSWKWKSAVIYLHTKYAVTIHLSLQQDLYNFRIRHFFRLILYARVS
jgi:hypothetical protein